MQRIFCCLAAWLGSYSLPRGISSRNLLPLAVRDLDLPPEIRQSDEFLFFLLGGERTCVDVTAFHRVDRPRSLVILPTELEDTGICRRQSTPQTLDLVFDLWDRIPCFGIGWHARSEAANVARVVKSVYNGVEMIEAKQVLDELGESGIGSLWGILVQFKQPSQRGLGKKTALAVESSQVSGEQRGARNPISADIDLRLVAGQAVGVDPDTGRLGILVYQMAGVVGVDALQRGDTSSQSQLDARKQACLSRPVLSVNKNDRRVQRD